MTISIKETRMISKIGHDRGAIDAAHIRAGAAADKVAGKAIKAQFSDVGEFKKEGSRHFRRGYLAAVLKPRASADSPATMKWAESLLARGAVRTDAENKAIRAANTALSRACDVAWPNRKKGSQGNAKKKPAKKPATVVETKPVLPIVPSAKAAPAILHKEVMAFIAATVEAGHNRKVCQTKAVRDLIADLDAVFKKYEDAAKS